jgi:hypothetical protein
MKRLLMTLLLGTVLGLSFVVPAPAGAQDDYWNNHWSWYDNTYRPYYYRGGYNTYYRPGYSTYGSYYGTPGYYSAPGYNAPGYSTYGYGTPYRQYYGTGGFGYGRTYGGGQAVNIGGLQFGWR